MDEAMPIFLSGLLLQTSIFGWVGLAPALLFSYGSAMFCNLYKESSKLRGGGFMPRVIGESLSAALLGTQCKASRRTPQTVPPIDRYGGKSTLDLHRCSRERGPIVALRAQSYL